MISRVHGRSVECHLLGPGSASLEVLVSASHQLVLITSLPFVHTARCYYHLDGLVRSLDCAHAIELLSMCNARWLIVPWPGNGDDKLQPGPQSDEMTR